MRILVVGAGATGGYFGARLALAGRDVTFLVRAARAEQLRAHGLRITSPHGDVTFAPSLLRARDVTPDYDLVILAVKAFALEAAIDDVAPAIGTMTMLLPLLNGMRHIETLSRRLGERCVLGGVCIVSTTVDDDGTIVQLNPMQQLVYGERDGTASARVEALDALLGGAGFEARRSAHIMQEMWEKWVMLATLGGITCLLRGNIGQIEAAPGGSALALQLLAECAAVAGAAGYPPGGAFLERSRALVTAAGSPLAASMYRDLQHGRHVEADQILGDLLRRAQEFERSTPLLAAAYAQLRIYTAGLAP